MRTNKTGKPVLPDVQTLIQAGFNPKTGLPLKFSGDSETSPRKEAVKKTLRILDEQNAVNRYVWYNLPCSLTSQELERLLYYRGQLAFFYIPLLDEFYFMPYALDGGLDFYGRFKKIHPVPIVASDTDEERKAYLKAQADYLSTIKLDVAYDISMGDKDPFTSCVLLHDYTKQLSETNIPRQVIQDPILDVMADMIPFARTALLNSTGVEGMRVNNQDELANVLAASKSLDRAALNGEKFVPMLGNVDFQELTGGSVTKAGEFLMVMQSLDNYRLSLYGLDNGGLFQKKTHMLEAEQSMNEGKAKSALQDGLAVRQHFCDVVNSIWGLGISCEISETAIQLDRDLDGDTSNNMDQSGMMQGEQPPMEVEE